MAAGTDILYAPTFTANRIKLEEYGLARQIRRNEPGTDRPVPKSGAGKSTGGSGYDDDRTTVISDWRTDV